ncbi:MAG: VOC family protein [Nitrospiraceae bacterium]|nr:VOC family protein [Nitrospiraceae bacterium]
MEKPLVTKLLHTRFRVSDLERTVRFYTDILGLTLASNHTSPRGSKIAYLKVPGSEEEIEIAEFPGSGDVVVPPDLVHLAFSVEDLETTLSRLKKLGVPITDGPTRGRNTTFFFIDAPEGYEIELIAPNPD